MLHAYRRHDEKCKHRHEGRAYTRCRCIVWADGTLGGKRYGRSLETRNWQDALLKIRDLEIDGEISSQNGEPISIETACAKFIRDAQARDLQKTTLQKYEVLFKQLKDFAKSTKLRFMHQLEDVDRLTEFRSTWPDASISSQKKLERLRAFCGFCCDRNWMKRNAAKKLKWPTVKPVQKDPFMQDEMSRILDATHIYPDNYGNLGGDNARRLRALTLLLRYSGLRLGDAAKMPRNRIEDGRLLLYTQKFGRHVYVPLPPFLVQALEEVAPLCPDPDYFFWTGRGTHHSVVGNWQRSFRKLFALAGFKKKDRAHPHRFRHTFAVEMLLAGTSIEHVSMLLGHSSVRITERHYASWVKARQDKLEADVRRAWEADPIASTLLQNGYACSSSRRKVKKKKEIKWWRRRESNPRPEMSIDESLHT